MQIDLTETIALLCVDQTSRWEAGEYVLVEDYYDQCPELIEDQEMLLDLIYNEIYLRDEYDQSCDRNSFRTRFPNLYDQIEFMLEIHEVIDAAFQSDVAFKRTAKVLPDPPGLRRALHSGAPPVTDTVTEWHMYAGMKIQAIRL